MSKSTAVGISSRLPRALLRSFLRWNRSDATSMSKISVSISNFGLPEEVLVDQSIRDIKCEEEMVALTRKCFNRLKCSSGNIDLAFNILKKLNEISTELRTSSVIHEKNSRADVISKAVWKVGQVVKHIQNGVRFVVIGWEVDSSTGIQSVNGLADLIDANEFMDKSFLYEKQHLLKAADLILVDDAQMLRLYNDDIQKYFLEFNPCTRCYVPRVDLAYLYPCDHVGGATACESDLGGLPTRTHVEHAVKSINSSLLSLIHQVDQILQQLDEDLTSLSAQNGVDSSQKLQLSKRQVLDDIFDILRQLKVQDKNAQKRSSNFHSVAAHLKSGLYARDGDVCWGAKRLAAAAIRNGLDPGSLDFDSTSCEHQVGSSPPVTGNDSSSSSSSSSSSISILDIRSISAKLGLVGSLFTKVEQLLQLRHQGHGLASLEFMAAAAIDSRSKFTLRTAAAAEASSTTVAVEKVPTAAVIEVEGAAAAPTENDSISFGLDGESFAGCAASSQQTDGGLSKPSPPHTAVHGGRLSDEANVAASHRSDPSASPPVVFSVGQVLRHKKFRYRCVVVGWDQRPHTDVDRWEGVVGLPLGSEQPFYKVLPDEDDVEEFIGQGVYRSQYYVAQENLEAVPRPVPIKQREIKYIFEGFNADKGKYIVPVKLRFCFPTQCESTRTTITTAPVTVTPRTFQQHQQQQFPSNTIDTSVNCNDGTMPLSEDQHDEVVEEQIFEVIDNSLLRVFGTLKSTFHAIREEYTYRESTDGTPSTIKELWLRQHQTDDAAAAAAVMETAFSGTSISKSLAGQTAAKELIPPMKLEDLLAVLQLAGSRDDAMKTESLIWHIWQAHTDPRVAAAMRRGMWQMRRARYQQAQTEFLTAFLLDPFFAEAQNKMSAICHRLLEQQESVYWAKETLKFFPSHYGAMSGLAMAHERVGRIDEAIDCVTRALQLHPWAVHLPTLLTSLRLARDKEAPAGMGFENGTDGPKVV